MSAAGGRPPEGTRPRARATAASERLTASAYGFGWTAARHVPEPLVRAGFRAIADAIWRRRGAGVLQLEANLRRVVGAGVDGERLRALSRAGMRSYLRYWMEVFRLPVTSRERILSDFRLEGDGPLWAALGSGRGVLLALPHSGNWDHAGAWIAARGYPLTTVAERLRPEALFDRFVAFREGLGMEVLPLGGRGVAGVLAQRLRAGRLVCLLADRDLTTSGVEVEFFGQPARMPTGPAALALHTGAALIPVTLWYEGDLWAGRIHGEVPVPGGGTRAERVAAMTRSMARAFEESVAAHPTDWHMLQPLWTTDLDAAHVTAPGAGEEGRRGGSERRSAAR